MQFCRSAYSHSLAVVCLLTAICTFAPVAQSQGVLTYRYNTERTGLNSAETTLTQSNVNVNTFGKLFVLSVDGVVDAEPLYLYQVKISGGTHNVLIVATENDSVYAFDADTGTQYWKITTLLSGETPSDDRDCDQVVPVIGITATPVVSKGVIYAVAMSKDSSGNYHQRLHALNSLTGAELYGGPVEITAQYPGSGDNSSNGYVIFDPAQYKERSGLLLANGTIYLAWASHCDIRPYTGWIMGYNSTTLSQTNVLNVTPNGNEGAIWGSGGGLAYDSNGNIFFLDANGVFDSTLNFAGYPSMGDYGNAFLRLSTKSGGLGVSGYFEMYNQAGENCCDIDLGSGAALILPTLTDATGKTWELAAGAGKDGNLYIVNRNSMGKFNSTANNIYQELVGVLPGGMWNSPVFSNSTLFYGPVGSPILAFKFKDAKLSGPVAQTAKSFGYPGATLIASSNNGANSILWAVENSNPGVLHAYSATTLAELYNTSQAANGRDNFGAANKYATPTVANGKVYVPTTTGVGVFGLLSAPK